MGLSWVRFPNIYQTGSFPKHMMSTYTSVAARTVQPFDRESSHHLSLHRARRIGLSWDRFPNSHLHVRGRGRDMVLLCEMQKSGEVDFDV